MSAQALEFNPWLQEPLEAGCLSPESAWKLHWELSELQGLPWTPGVYQINQTVVLFHWNPEHRSMQ